MTDILTVACDADVRCKLTTTVAPECPVADERDHYQVTVSWQPNGDTLEKHALLSHIHEFDGAELTHESLVATLYESVADADVVDVTVTARDTTHAEMVVTKE